MHVGSLNLNLEGLAMTVPKRVLPFLLVAPLMIVAVSCVDSKHPLSDEKTSKIDERLIGTWQDEDKTTWRVTKSAAAKNSLALEWKKKGQDDSGKAIVFTTVIKTKNYLSIRDTTDETPKDQKEAYNIYQYRLIDNDTVELRGMRPEVLKKAIEGKLLTGTILKDNVPTITDSPDVIKSYLEAHADECYPVKTDLMLTFKRQK